MSIDWEIVASIAIIGVMLFLAFGSGRKNPVSTGDLEKRVYEDIHKIKNEMQAIEGRIAVTTSKITGFATKDDIAELRRDLSDAAADRTEKAGRELGKIRETVATVCTKVEGLEKNSEATAAGIRRIEGYFLQKGIDSK